MTLLLSSPKLVSTCCSSSLELKISGPIVPSSIYHILRSAPLFVQGVTEGAGYTCGWFKDTVMDKAHI